MPNLSSLRRPLSRSNVPHLFYSTLSHPIRTWTPMWSRRCLLHQNIRKTIRLNDRGNGAVPCLPQLHRLSPNPLLESLRRSLLSPSHAPGILKSWAWDAYSSDYPSIPHSQHEISDQTLPYRATHFSPFRGELPFPQQTPLTPHH